MPCSAALLLSVTVTVKPDVSGVVGVPLRIPVEEFNVNHVGKLPALTAKVYVPEPPVALKVALNGLLAVAFGRAAGLTVRLLAVFTVNV